MSGLILPRRFGSNFTGTPSNIIRLEDRATLSRMVPAASKDWQSGMTLNNDPIGNDRYGCCVEAAIFRFIQAMLTNSMGSGWVPTTDQVLDFYAAVTGFDPRTGANDNGTNPNDAFDRWLSTGIQVNPQLLDVPSARVSLDPQNLDHLKIAVETLCGVLLTLRLTQADQEAAEWANAAPGPIIGEHEVMVARHDTEGLWCVTWGMQFFMSPAFIAARCLAANAFVSRRWIETTGFSPAGLNLDDLEAEAAQLRAA